MDTLEKQPASVHTISSNSLTVGKSNTETRYQGPKSRRNRKMYIILGVVILVVIVLAVAISVPVVVTNNNNKNTQSSKQKNNCGPFSYPEIDISSLTPRIISARKTCPLKGDCWTGEQCYQCFKRPTWKVGNINNIPVCCANCEISGLSISDSECFCRHNGG